MNITRDVVLFQLEAFRSGFTQIFDAATGSGVDEADRTAAQEGLQLVWSFAVGGIADGVELDDARWELLRDCFPDELFEPEPDEAFIELSEKVPNSYAERWKLYPSDHLCDLIRGCVTVGDASPLVEYRIAALQLAAVTCGSLPPITARTVFDVARYDSMLKRARVLTEVAVSEANLLDDDQIKSFCVRSGEGSSLSFTFMEWIDPILAADMTGTFAEHHGKEVTDGLLAEALAEFTEHEPAPEAVTTDGAQQYGHGPGEFHGSPKDHEVGEVFRVLRRLLAEVDSR